MQPEELLSKLAGLPEETRRGILARLDDSAVVRRLAELTERIGTGETPTEDWWVTGGGGIAGPLWGRLAAELARDPEEDEALVGQQIGPVRIEAVLGRGGMGAVYRGFDTWLERPVAVKTLRRGLARDPDALERLRREARILSRLDHPHICRVHGIQRHGAEDHLILELIDGAPLSTVIAGDELDSRARLRIARDVASALVAAHQRRIIHRDLKPSNILLTPEGRAKVLDFGISSRFDVGEADPEGADPESVDLEILGPIGTAAYMSPEQARGEPLTPASDLYSLGLVLQELFTGKPARSRELDLRQLLDRARRGERLPAEGVAAEIAELIDGLTRSEPSRRPSADEVARRLNALAAGPRVRARRRRRIAMGLAAGLALALLAGGTLASRWRLQRQADLAQRFGQEVKDLEARMRAAYLLPLHDIRPEKEAVRARLNELEEVLEEAGDLAFGAGHLALGQGYLALDEPARARDFLERAWDRGDRPPELAFAYGQALGRLLDRAPLGAWKPSAEPERRESLRRRAAQVADLLRTGAPVGGVAGGAADGVIAEYPQALLAFYEERFEEALTLARRAADRATWLYPARVLEGEIQVSLGEILRDGGDYAGAERHLDAADAAYAAAARVGESDPSVHEHRCRLAAQRMQLRYYGSGGDLETPYLAARETCGKALTADPSRASAHAVVAQIEERWVEAMQDKGGDVAGALERGIAAASRAVELAPDYEAAYSALGTILYTSARLRAREGEDVEPILDRAIRALDRAVELAPDQVENYNRRGIAYRTLAGIRASTGADPHSAYEAAAASYRRAVELAPESTYFANNLGHLLVRRARSVSREGEDPRPLLEEAVANLERALENNPNNPIALNNLGDAWNALGQARAERGLSPEAALARAGEFFERTLEVNPTYASPFNNLGMIHWRIGRWRVLHGEDPGAQIALARPALERAAELAPKAFQPVMNLGRIAWVEAEHRLRGGNDPRRAVERSVALYRRVLALGPGVQDARLEAAEVIALAAAWELERGGPGARWLGRARELAEEAFAAGSVEGPAHRVLGRLDLLEARFQQRDGRAPGAAFERASRHLEAARRAGQDDVELHGALAELERHRAEWLLAKGGAVGSAVRSGLAHCDRALSRHPGHPDVEATGAALARLGGF